MDNRLAVCIVGIVLAKPCLFNALWIGYSCLYRVFRFEAENIRKSSVLLLFFPWLFVLCIPLIQVLGARPYQTLVITALRSSFAYYRVMAECHVAARQENTYRPNPFTVLYKW